MCEMRRILALPDGCPTATAGVVLPGGREVVTGLANGDVYKWDIGEGSHERVFGGRSRISAIDMSGGTLLVSAKEGPLLTIDAASYSTETLREWSQSTSSRVWKCAWLGGGRAVMTSTYGGIYVYEREPDGMWAHSQLHGHTHSVFAVGVHSEDIMATGDWLGRIVVWERRNGAHTASAAGVPGMSGAVEALVWADERTLAGIDANGLIRLFEFDAATGRWTTAYELDVAAGQGTSMHLTDDKKTLLASTQAEVVQVDLETLRWKTLPLEGVVSIYSAGDSAYVIAGDGMYALPIEPIEESPDMVEYKHVKVSLIGHTGVGKSTLCSTMSKTAPRPQVGVDSIRSTFGRRIWTLRIGSGRRADARQVTLHDHGGQKSVLPTLLPAAEDSDMVLALFRRTDRSTFDAACENLTRLRTKRYNGEASRVLIATHADHDLEDVTDDDMRRAVENFNASGFLSINAKTEDGAEAVRKLFDDAGLWNRASKVVKSERNRAVEVALDYWENVEGKSVLNHDDIKSMTKDLAGTAVPEAHLAYLLKSMDRRGLLTYYSEIGQVVLNDSDHDRVRSGIPMLADRHNGVVEADKIDLEYGSSRYAGPVLSALKSSGACIECRDRLVFPHLLRDGPVDVPDGFKKQLQSPMFSEVLAFNAKGVDASELIRAAAALNLPCVDATRTGALFASEGGASLYYSVVSTDNPLGAPRTQIEYRVGGTRRVFCEALADEFTTVARRLGGPEILLGTVPQVSA